MLEGKKVLIVDDEPDIREILLEEFKQEGATTFEAADGLDALTIIEANQVDAVVSDIRMPKKNGIELLKWIKARGAKAPLVVLFSGYSELSKEDAYHLGADALFGKPFDPQELVEQVAVSLLPAQEKFVRLSERFPVDYIVEMSFSDISLPLRTKAINLGRGGMFITMENEFPSFGDNIYFRLLIETPKPHLFEGVGKCKWIRKEATKQLSSGIGIEFVSLSKESLRILQEILNSLGTKAIIPKN